METLIRKIREKAEGILPGERYFIVNISLKGGKGNRRLEVLIDGDEGIDIRTCSRISRDLSEWLDKSELISGKYVLEVGSPGVDYPLSTERQYRRNIGRDLRIIMKDNDMITGKLVSVGNGRINIEKRIKGKKKGAESTEIPLEEIRKSTVIVSLK